MTDEARWRGHRRRTVAGGRVMTPDPGRPGQGLERRAADPATFLVHG